MELTQFLSQMTPDIYRTMKESLELGRWPNGEPLTATQRDASLQALIAWEHENLPEEERTGYMPLSCGKETSPDTKEPEASILRFKDE